jgi:hypothetical protein
MKKIIPILLIFSVISNILINITYAWWETKNSMSSIASFGWWTSIGNKIYVPWWETTGCSSSNVNQIYDISTNSWSNWASLPQTSRFAGVTSIWNKVYVIWWVITSSTTNKVNIYDISTNSWSNWTVHPRIIKELRLASYNNKIYTIWGYDGSARTYFYEYDPSSDTWTQKASMSTWRRDPAVAILWWYLYAIGWCNGSNSSCNSVTSSVERYNFSSNSWSSVASLPEAIRWAGTFVYNNEIYVVGWDDNSSTKNTIYKYNPSSNTWSLTLITLNTARTDVWVSFINDTLYVYWWTTWTYCSSATWLVESYSFNTTPSISSVSVPSYINNSNYSSTPFTINGINDSDSSQTLTYKYSWDWSSWTDIWSQSTPISNWSYSFNLNTSGRPEWSNILRIKINDGSSDSNTVTSVNITKDTSTPSVSWNNDSASWRSSHQTITLSTSDGTSWISQARYSWSNDLNAWCTSGWNTFSDGNTITTNSRGDWNHTLYLCTVDNAGNTSSTTKTYKIDTTVPTVNANNDSASWRNTHQTITLSTSDGTSWISQARYSWSNDLNAWCTSGWNTFSDGNTITTNSRGDWNHTLYLCTVDNAGNTSSTTKTYKIDTTSPTVANITSISSPNNDITPNYTFSSTEAWSITYGWLCSSSTSTAAVWSNTITLNSLSDWTYNNCTIRVTDQAGNISSIFNIPTFTIDTAPPSTPSSLLINSWWLFTNNPNVNLNITHPNQSDVYQWCVISVNNPWTCSWTTTKPTIYNINN